MPLLPVGLFGILVNTSQFGRIFAASIPTAFDQHLWFQNVCVFLMKANAEASAPCLAVLAYQDNTRSWIVWLCFCRKLSQHYFSEMNKVRKLLLKRVHKVWACNFDVELFADRKDSRYHVPLIIHCGLLLNLQHYSHCHQSNASKPHTLPNTLLQSLQNLR